MSGQKLLCCPLKIKRPPPFARRAPFRKSYLGFLIFLPLVAYAYFLYSLCVVLCDLRKILRAKFEL